jgi:hypothetical protein
VHDPFPKNLTENVLLFWILMKTFSCRNKIFVAGFHKIHRSGDAVLFPHLLSLQKFKQIGAFVAAFFIQKKPGFYLMYIEHPDSG